MLYVAKEPLEFPLDTTLNIPIDNNASNELFKPNHQGHRKMFCVGGGHINTFVGPPPDASILDLYSYMQ